MQSLAQAKRMLPSAPSSKFFRPASIETFTICDTRLLKGSQGQAERKKKKRKKKRELRKKQYLASCHFASAVVRFTAEWRPMMQLELLPPPDRAAVLHIGLSKIIDRHVTTCHTHKSTTVYTPSSGGRKNRDRKDFEHPRVELYAYKKITATMFILKFGC
ncbi:hypothetical protein H0G86_009556 [Trichoderma simmonsii]|uniref:Uncharacterized protein n=1 Tax=Trichoderma simmonsii TaxID=1491479 RepID=A0A8G0PN46_9HYPO|nr:hypothetical protein H0G86_009556 [Trichoderma simmonsii]